MQLDNISLYLYRSNLQRDNCIIIDPASDGLTLIYITKPVDPRRQNYKYFLK